MTDQEHYPERISVNLFNNEDGCCPVEILPLDDTPGKFFDPSEAVEYVRADLFEAELDRGEPEMKETDKLPERILAWQTADNDSGKMGQWFVPISPDVDRTGYVEYIRVNIHDALAAENEALRARQDIRGTNRLMDDVADHIRRDGERIAELEAALRGIRDEKGVCGTCGEPATGPGMGAVNCDCSYPVWDPVDPRDRARAALAKAGRVVMADQSNNDQTILAELTRAKALFQQLPILAHMGAMPPGSKDDQESARRAAENESLRAEVSRLKSDLAIQMALNATDFEVLDSPFKAAAEKAESERDQFESEVEELKLKVVNLKRHEDALIKRCVETEREIEDLLRETESLRDRCKHLEVTKDLAKETIRQIMEEREYWKEQYESVALKLMKRMD